MRRNSYEILCEHCFLITFVDCPTTIGDKEYLYKQKNNQNL